MPPSSYPMSYGPANHRPLDQRLAGSPATAVDEMTMYHFSQSIPAGLSGSSTASTSAAHHPSSLIAGPSRLHDDRDAKKDKRRKESATKHAKEPAVDRRDDRHYTETIAALSATAHELALRPASNAAYNLRMYPISLKRTAWLSKLEYEERIALDNAQVAYEEERKRVEEEWKRGRERLRERMLEGIEERRRRAREEKEGEGTVGDGSLDAQSRGHITRKLRNKLGTSPPPTPAGNGAMGGVHTNGALAAYLPLSNPNSLSVDELPSPFPLPLTSTQSSMLHSGGSGGGGAGAGGMGGTNGLNGSRRKAKTSHQAQSGQGALGKSIFALLPNKDGEAEIEGDLSKIRRANKRRRTAAQGMNAANRGLS